MPPHKGRVPDGLNSPRHNRTDISHLTIYVEPEKFPPVIPLVVIPNMRSNVCRPAYYLMFPR